MKKYGVNWQKSIQYYTHEKHYFFKQLSNTLQACRDDIVPLVNKSPNKKKFNKPKSSENEEQSPRGFVKHVY